MLENDDVLELMAELMEYANKTGYVINISSNFDRNISPIYSINSIKPVDFVYGLQIYEMNINVNVGQADNSYYEDIERILLPYGFVIASASMEANNNFITSNLHAVQTKEPDDVL